MLKIWKLALWKSSDVAHTFRWSLLFQRFSQDDIWESETFGFEPRNRQRRSTSNNLDILILKVCLHPRFLITYATISADKQAVLENYPDSPRFSPRRFYLQADDGKNQYEFRQLWQIDNYLSISLKWKELLKQDHTFFRNSSV